LEGPLKSLPRPSFLEGLEGAPALLLGLLKPAPVRVLPLHRPGATLPHRRPSSCPHNTIPWHQPPSRQPIATTTITTPLLHPNSVGTPSQCVATSDDDLAPVDVALRTLLRRVHPHASATCRELWAPPPLPRASLHESRAPPSLPTSHKASPDERISHSCLFSTCIAS
jgi:hypothetical protein